MAKVLRNQVKRRVFEVFGRSTADFFVGFMASFRAFSFGSWPRDGGFPSEMLP